MQIPKQPFRTEKKGYGILSEMRAILQDIPLGVRRYEMGLTLRQAWFLNGTLYNSEVWCALSKSDLNVLEVLDRKILRLILGAHSKAPSEMLYLETGVLPIRHVVALRRLCYLKNILNRNDNEIIKQVYEAQRKHPCKGDWVNLIQTDMDNYDLNLSDEVIKDMKDNDYKLIIKEKNKEKSILELENTRSGHDKVNLINLSQNYIGENYLTSGLFNNKQISMLFNLRCQTLKNIKNYFHNLYKGDITCPFKCSNEIDSQEHVIKCHKIVSNMNSNQKMDLNNVKCQDIFGNTHEQLEVTKVFQTMIGIRDRLQKRDQEPACLGKNTGPSG